MVTKGSAKSLGILSSLETSTVQGKDLRTTGGRGQSKPAELTPLSHLPYLFPRPSLPHSRPERGRIEAKGLIAKLRSFLSVSRLENWITKLSSFLNALDLSKALGGGGWGWGGQEQKLLNLTPKGPFSSKICLQRTDLGISK